MARTTVMGSTAEVIVVGGNPGLDGAGVERLHDLEAKWSRFRRDSDVCRINDNAGFETWVAPETIAVLERAVDAWRWTKGLFDPTVHASMCRLGYDRSFDTVSPSGPAVVATRPAPGCEGVEVASSCARVPVGVAIDLGGIGKGFAADLVLAELLDGGADGACVNVGGDVALGGVAPPGSAWIVGVDDPFCEGNEVLQLALAAGGVATSSRLRRHWQRGGLDVHHVLDPRTGMSASSAVAATTVVAGTASDAEVLAKAILVDPAVGSDLVCSAGAAALVFRTDRSVSCVGDIARLAA